MEPSGVESAVVGQREHEAALSSTVGWARTAPFEEGLLKPGTAGMRAVVVLVVGVWMVVGSLVAADTDTRSCSGAWGHTCVRNRQGH